MSDMEFETLLRSIPRSNKPIPFQKKRQMILSPPSPSMIYDVPTPIQQSPVKPPIPPTTNQHFNSSIGQLRLHR